MKKSDLLWILAYPIYQLVGTFRHEVGHAVSAWLEGAYITEFVFWPTVREGRGFSWGHVRWEGQTSWVTTAAPYFLDLVTFFLFLWICMRFRFRRRWVWINAIAIGLISPFVNSLYNYWGGQGSLNDVGRLFVVLPGAVVHLYFILTLILYSVGLLGVLKYSETARAWAGSE
jgi:hypothetical protein